MLTEKLEVGAEFTSRADSVAEQGIYKKPTAGEPGEGELCGTLVVATCSAEGLSASYYARQVFNLDGRGVYVDVSASREIEAREMIKMKEALGLPAVGSHIYFKPKVRT